MTIQFTWDIQSFHQRLEQLSGRKLLLRLNQNRTTYLSITPCTSVLKVSLHQAFLQAPMSVVQALGSYLKGKGRQVRSVIRHFIEDFLQGKDFSHQIDRSKLQAQGRFFDLTEVYSGLNETFFDGQVDLGITWFGRQKKYRSKQVTLGLYYDTLRVVKIHKLLDQAAVPRFVVDYVAYHEMLHHVYPPYRDEKGRNRIHHKEFQEAERSFPRYKEANEWIAANKQLLFAN